MHKALVLSVLGLRCFITLEQRNNFRNVCSQQEKKNRGETKVLVREVIRQ